MLNGHVVIGLFVPMLREYLQNDLYRAVASRCAEYGYKLFVYNSANDFKFDDKYSRGEAAICNYVDYDVIDGLIINGEMVKDQRLLTDMITKARQHDVFTVCVDKYIEGCCNIEFNYHSAFEAIVRHILEKHGCKVINVMAGQKGNSFSEERVDCVRRVMAEHGMKLDEKRIQYGEFWTAPTLMAMEEFAKSGMEMPEVFICCNDSMAMAVCGWLKSHGYAVPDDVLVTGFDGMFEEQFHIPRLTTAKQDNELAGTKSVDMVAAHIEGRRTDSFSIIDHRVVYSHSCGCRRIDYREASGLIFPLFDMMSEDNANNVFLFELDDKVSVSTGLMELSSNVMEYSSVYGWHYYALCLNDNFMNISDDRKGNNSGGMDDARLVLCERLDGIATPPYCGKRPVKIYEAAERYNILLFWPVHFQDLNVGYGVCALSNGGDGFTKNDDMRRFSMYARHLNHALEVVSSQSVMKKVIDRLQTLYKKDHTGLLNRNGFYTTIKERLDSALEEGFRTYLVIISMDMDGLKTINDNYGHAEGDVAINAIAAALKSVWGDEELCARFGGDEFTIASICSADPQDRGIEITAKIKEHLQRFNDTSGKPYKVRGSYGIWFEQITDGLDVDMLIKHADDLMYKEKSTHTESRYSRQ